MLNFKRMNTITVGMRANSKIAAPGPSTEQHKSMSTPSYRHILDLYFKQSEGRQIVSHQLESFNHFMDIDIPEIVQQVNPLIVRGSPETPLSGPRSALASATGLSTSAANALMGRISEAMATSSSAKYEYEVALRFENVSLRKPTIFENNGAILPMMPNDARMRNLTYASPLFVDVRITTTFIDNTKGGERQTKERLFPNVHLGKIPVMVGSKYCLLHDQKHLEPIALGECAEDYGGYVIVGGGEPDAQAFAEAVVAEVVETGLAARGLENGVFPQRKRPAARCLDGGALRIVEPRTGQVVDANFGGAHLAPARFQAIE